jgi:hypothetical protein
MAAMHIGGDTFANVNAAARDYMLTNQSALQAAAGDVLTSDTPGLLPVPVLGPVFEDLNYIRPVVAAVGARAMPDGGQSKTWIRPTWTTHTSVAAQGSELGAASATTPVIASNVVTKTTLAGQVTCQFKTSTLLAQQRSKSSCVTSQASTCCSLTTWQPTQSPQVLPHQVQHGQLPQTIQAH